MRADAVVAAADENFVVHLVSLQQSTPGMCVRRSERVVMTDSGLPCDTFNIVCRARWTEAEARTGIPPILAHYTHPFSWWLSPGDLPRNLGALLEEHGLTQQESELMMFLELGSIAGAPPPLRIERVRTREQLRDFAAVTAANWDPPDEHVVRFFEQVAPAALRDDCPRRFFVGYAEDRAVAASQSTISGGTAGIYNVGTLAQHRRRGFGTAMTQWALLDAQRDGAVLAILHAAPDGVSVYRRLGFRECGEIREYKRTL